MDLGRQEIRDGRQRPINFNKDNRKMMQSATDLVGIADSERYQEADAQRLARMAEANDQGKRWFRYFSPDARLATLERPTWRLRSTNMIKTYWWVPAGFAVLVLLGTIVGG
jgi:hypothetical protein